MRPSPRPKHDPVIKVFVIQVINAPSTVLGGNNAVEGLESRGKFFPRLLLLSQLREDVALLIMRPGGFGPVVCVEAEDLEGLVE